MFARLRDSVSQLTRRSAVIYSCRQPVLFMGGREMQFKRTQINKKPQQPTLSDLIPAHEKDLFCYLTV